MRQMEQRIAEAESSLARLREKSRRENVRQMILLGATVFAEAERSAGFKAWLISRLEAALKPADEGAVRKLVERLQKLAVKS